MTRLCIATALAWAALLIAPAADAVLLDSSADGNESAPADDPGWSYVGLRGGLNAVYVGYGWVLTARHVPQGPVTLVGASWPDVPGSRVVFEHVPGTYAELAAFRIEPYPAAALPLLPIRDDPDPPALGTPVVMIGSGQRRGTATSWNGHAGWLWAGGAVKRWGTNAIGGDVNDDDGYPLRVPTVIVNLAGTQTWSLVTDFTEELPTPQQEATDDEAALTVGDSGGALFIEEGGTWQLAGVAIAIGTFFEQPVDRSLYENDAYYADLGYYAGDVLDVVRPCSDGADNDADALADYPADPGCTWPGDPSEQPDCGDGLDNDGDGLFDLADPDCASAGGPLEEPDQEGDLVPDDSDNCLALPNADQRDTDLDGYGNACDGDYDGDGVVGVPDFDRMAAAFGTQTGDPGFDADLDANDNGGIGVAEFSLVAASLGGPPGPSGAWCAAAPPCLPR